MAYLLLHSNYPTFQLTLTCVRILLCPYNNQKDVVFDSKVYSLLTHTKFTMISIGNCQDKFKTFLLRISGALIKVSLG